tara:strand:+ start:254 stop:448 length:195 start_codon:yes stop_codon:yes gene_type:complete
MTDNLERLRRYFPPPTQKTILIEVALVQWSADEIERLRARVNRQECDIAYLTGWKEEIEKRLEL